jgi:hypothetical protein
MKLWAIGILVVAGAALAGSLPFSRAGVMDAPDAYILRHTEIQVGLAGAAYTFQDASGSNSEFKFTGFLDVGLFGFGQAGVSYLGDGGVAGNVKIGVVSEGIQVPAFAIGLENISGEQYVDCFSDSSGSLYQYDHAQNWSAYGVASKDLGSVIGIPATISLGIGIGRFVGVIDNGAVGAGSKWAHGLFGSVVFRPSEAVGLAFEQDGRDLNIGASYELGQHVTIQLAWAEFEQTVFPPEGQNKTDIMQNSKFSLSLQSTIGPIIGAGRLELERERTRIQRARERLQELEARRRAAEEELQRLRDLLEERN